MMIAAGAGAVGLAYYIYSNQNEQSNNIDDTKNSSEQKIRSKFEIVPPSCAELK